MCVFFCIQKRDFMTRNNCLCLAQEYQDYMGSSSHLWFCACKNRLWTRITSFCGSQTPPVVFACKTANSGPEYQVSMGPRHDLSFCACTTACLASESLVSMGQNRHLQISIAKQRLLVQNYKSLWAQTSLVVLCMQTIVISTRITRLYGSQTSPVVLCMQNSVPSIGITSLYGSQHSSVLFACKTVW